jgi:hypothetical protein
MSTVLDHDRHGRIGQDYFAYFANPYNVTRTLVLMLREVVSELWSAAQQRRLDIQPRIKRDFVYAIMRAWATVIQRDLQIEAVIADMYAGRPVVYTTFLAYDEVAHHSGIERSESLLTLRRVDRQIRRVAAAAKGASRPYRLVVLSDHGQSQGTTFLDRYGETLEHVVREAAEAATVEVAAQSDEAVGYLGASLTEASGGDSRAARAVHRLTRRRKAEEQTVRDEAEPLPELVVMASGCLGLVSFPREPGRLTMERLADRYPGVVPALRDHPGIGFILVRSEREGALAIGADGINYLDRGVVEGTDPLAPFGVNAARHVKRTDGFAHCPDIVINSTYWSQTDEVAAFEELVGSHGGMGGAQSFPFLLHPLELGLEETAMVGAESVHRQLRRWLTTLGHAEYAQSPQQAESPAQLREQERQ